MTSNCPNGAIRGRNAAILAVILTSYVMIVLDISIVITGLPRLAAELRFSDAGLSWVQSCYTLTFGGFLLLGASSPARAGRPPASTTRSGRSGSKPQTRTARTISPREEPAPHHR